MEEKISPLQPPRWQSWPIRRTLVTPIEELTNQYPLHEAKIAVPFLEILPVIAMSIREESTYSQCYAYCNESITQLRRSVAVAHLHVLWLHNQAAGNQVVKLVLSQRFFRSLSSELTLLSISSSSDLQTITKKTKATFVFARPG